MDRMSGGEPNIHFEAPQVEINPSDQERRVERDQPDYHETAPSKAPSSPAQVAPQITPIQQPVDQSQKDTAQQSPTSATPPITAPLTAADGNNIEKEWVEATKFVIDKTRSDPYRQKLEVSRIKADYQMKRFNKHPSADDAVAA